MYLHSTVRLLALLLLFFGLNPPDSMSNLEKKVFSIRRYTDPQRKSPVMHDV